MSFLIWVIKIIMLTIAATALFFVGTVMFIYELKGIDILYEVFKNFKIYKIICKKLDICENENEKEIKYEQDRKEESVDDVK